MKTYEETLAAVLARRDEFESARQKTRRAVYGGVSATVCCVSVAAAVLLWHRSDTDLPVEQENPAGVTTTVERSDGDLEQETAEFSDESTTGKEETGDTVTELAPSGNTTAKPTVPSTTPVDPEGDTTVVVTSGIVPTTGVEQPTTGVFSYPTSSAATDVDCTTASPTQYTEIPDPTEDQLPEWFATITAFKGTYDLLPGGSWPLKEALEPKDLWLHHTVRDENGRYVGEKQVTATFYSVEGWENKEVLALTFKDYDTILYYAMREDTDATKY